MRGMTGHAGLRQKGVEPNVSLIPSQVLRRRIANIARRAVPRTSFSDAQRALDFKGGGLSVGSASGGLDLEVGAL